MDVVIAGSHGLIGTALLEDLRGVDAVVNLGGVGLGDHRWTPRYRQEILQSRTDPTALIARTLADLAGSAGAPTVLLQGSAVGYYGDRGDEILTEASTPGVGFLPDVVQAWEAATATAEQAGVRVAHLRTGIVMARDGGSFGRLLSLLRLGVGGPLGSGRNVWSWITLADQIGAIEHLLTADVRGPVNLTAPTPARQSDVVAAVARELHRPSVLRVPRVALKIAIGDFADDVLSSQHALPTVLTASGYEHVHPDLAAAAAWLTGRTNGPR